MLSKFSKCSPFLQSTEDSEDNNSGVDKIWIGPDHGSDHGWKKKKLLKNPKKKNSSFKK